METIKPIRSGRSDPNSLTEREPKQILSVYSNQNKNKSKSLCELYFETELDNLQKFSRLRRYIRTTILRCQRLSKSVEDMNFEFRELDTRLCILETLIRIREESIKELNKVIDDVRLNNFELAVKGETVKNEIFEIIKEDHFEQQVMKMKFHQRECSLIK